MHDGTHAQARVLGRQCERLPKDRSFQIPKTKKLRRIVQTAIQVVPSHIADVACPKTIKTTFIECKRLTRLRGEEHKIPSNLRSAQVEVWDSVIGADP